MLKNIFNTFFVRVFNAVVTLAIAIIISRFLGAEIKGEQGLILTTISLLHIVMCVIGSGAIIYLIPRISYTKLILPSYLWIIIVSVLFYFISPIIAAVPKEFALHISAVTILVSLSNLHISSLIAKEKIILANTLTLFQTVLQIAILLLGIFCLEDLSVTPYLYSLYGAYVISYLLALFVSFSHFKIERQDFSFSGLIEGAKQLTKYGFFNQLDVFAQVLSFRFSYYILALYFNESLVGVYSIAISIAESIWLISRSISMVHYARVSNTEDSQKNIKLTISFIKIATVLTLFAVIFVLLLPSQFYVLVFGEEFWQVKEILYYIVLGIVFFSASFMISGYFSGIGKQYINCIASLVGFAITILGAFILIPQFGVVGAALTATISYAGTTLVKMVYFFKKSGEPLSSLCIVKSDFELAKGGLSNVLNRSKY